MHFTPATADRIDRDLAKVVNGKMPAEGLGQPLQSIYDAGRIAERAEATAAEAALLAAYDDFLAGRISGAELPYPLSHCYQRGRWELEAELDAANAAADRWHAIATRQERPVIPPESLADRERIRGYPERAARIDEANRARFGDAA